MKSNFKTSFLRTLLMTTVFVLPAATGCKKIKDQLEQPKLPPPQTGSAEQVAPALGISLDAAVSEKERTLFKEDIRFLQNINFKPEPEGYFFKAFSFNGALNILKFIDDRVGFIIGRDTSVDSRFSYTSNTGNHSGKAVTIATNIGMAVWLETIAQKRPIQFFVNNTSVPVNDPRVGIIRLAEGYTNYDGEGRPMNTVARTTVLIHEARHSDCTGGLSERDAINLAAGQLPENRSCGHLHTICESGDYEGLAACDGREWGSYAMGWLYANEFKNNCESCNEAMRQTARVVAIDSLLRVGEGRAASMLSKSLPPPDLSSTPTLR
ncbi:MAG: hypothetical protein EBR09_03785 [Proteobacteria bacterium]|nr:hypothetical protein [Pseudomonadota bacterium]